MKVETYGSLEKYAQIISSEMMDALRKSAQVRGVSLDMEIALRLTTYMAEPDLTQDNILSQQILRLDFNERQAIAECKRKRESALYVYEMEKLKLFLQFEKNLPRNMKETFTMIDLKAATKQIKAELAVEEKNNRQNQGE